MTRTLDRTKDIFLDTMLLGNEILIKKIKTTNKTKVTVVLAAFRNVENLKDRIVELSRQDFQEFEIIVVDDSSSLEFEEYVNLNDNNRVNYIKKQLGSSSSANNCALEFSKGEYIVFVEENVSLHSDYVRALYTLASEKNLDIAIQTRKGYKTIFNTVVTGERYLVEEIQQLKSDLDYNLTSYIFKKKFLDVYNLKFQEDMLSLENLYFKLKTFDVATKVNSINKCCYEDKKEEKTVRNQAMIDASVRRIMLAAKKIEEFKIGKTYEDSLNLLYGYLLFDILRMSKDMEDEKELLELIKSKKNYFNSDTFKNKMMINISPILFANHLNRKDRS